ncbi:MAG: hypothetical protein ACFFA0_04700 [Promethearchaeota archaeon]
MITRKIIEDLVNKFVYIYIKNISKDFAGRIKSINECDIILLEDKNENISYIPLSEVSVITERR